MTSEQTRTALLNALADLGRLHPEWRFGQTLANVAMAAGRLEAGAVWDLEDDEALAAVRAMLTRRTSAEARRPVDA
ncbi:MAG TPA: hypothetical protein VM597_37335 [Gemmataceae bacterium]|jgi:hypothetical protein|nr:hypothetical protein [Gemmataceae bacterium]